MGFPIGCHGTQIQHRSILGYFWWDLGFREVFQWTGNGSGIQIDEFSAQIEPYSSIWKNFDDFAQFGIVSSDLGSAWAGLETSSGDLSLAKFKANIL